MWEEIEGLMHLKVFLPTRPVTLIKDITSPCKSCFNSKHSTFLWGLCGTDPVQCNLNLAPSTQGFLMQSPPEGIRGPTVTCMTGKQHIAVNEVPSWKDGRGTISWLSKTCWGHRWFPCFSYSQILWWWAKHSSWILLSEHYSVTYFTKVHLWDLWYCLRNAEGQHGHWGHRSVF